jgi:hypothetical protein
MIHRAPIWGRHRFIHGLLKITERSTNARRRRCYWPATETPADGFSTVYLRLSGGSSALFSPCLSGEIMPAACAASSAQRGHRERSC